MMSSSSNKKPKPQSIPPPTIIRRKGEISASSSLTSTSSSADGHPSRAQFLASSLPGGFTPGVSSSAPAKPRRPAAAGLPPGFKPLFKPMPPVINKQTAPSLERKELKELEELRRWKAQREADDAKAKKDPIPRPIGEPGRGPGKTKKNKKGIHKERKTYVLTEKMKCTEAKIKKYKKRLNELQAKAGVPRGAVISNGELSGEVEKWEEFIGEEFPELMDNTYEGNWPTRILILQILAGQRKHDRAQGKKDAAKEGGDEGGNLTANAKPHARRKAQHPSLNSSHSGSDCAESDGGQGDDVDDDDDSGLLHRWAFAQLGPTLGNLVVDYQMFNLAEDWADYKTQDEADEWVERDHQIQGWIDMWGRDQALERLGEGCIQWLVSERLGNGDSFNAVWKVICVNRFDYAPSGQDDDNKEAPKEDVDLGATKIPPSTKRKPSGGNAGDDDERQPVPPKKARTAHSDDIYGSESDVSGDEYTPPSKSQTGTKRHVKNAEEAAAAREHPRRPTRGQVSLNGAEETKQ